jgi:uncharacterized protein DUF4038/collagenase-like protein with putative collagen-binding domain
MTRQISSQYIPLVFTLAFFAGCPLTAGELINSQRLVETEHLVIDRAPVTSGQLPLAVERGKPYLVDAFGRPFFLHGDTAWSLIEDLKREDAELYLSDRRHRGFNALLVNLLEHRFSRNAPRNYYGEEPFHDGDFSRPNERYFEHADWVLNRASELGLVVLLAPAYAGANGGTEGWWREMQANGVGKLRQYGEFLGKRYRHSKNIVWTHGGDYNPPDRSLIEAVIEGISAHDTAALHTAHCDRETMASEYWGDRPWLQIDTLYTYGPVHLQAVKAAQEFGKRPYILLESAYEFEHTAGELRVRAQAYQALLNGAAGHVFGNNPIWHFDGPGIFPAPIGWREALSSRGSQSMTHLLNLFSQLEWWRLRPDLKNEFLVAGHGRENARAVAALSEDRSLGLVYTPGRRSLDIDWAGFMGQVEARWYDPSSGVFKAATAAREPAKTIRHFETPGRNEAGLEDWVLVLTAVR